jgi:integrase
MHGLYGWTEKTHIKKQDYCLVVNNYILSVCLSLVSVCSVLKERSSKKVPISNPLKAVLQRLPRAIHNNHVFLYKGKPVIDIRDGLKRGLETIGLPYGRKVQGGFTFHDLRHTTKTFMRKAGID